MSFHNDQVDAVVYSMEDLLLMRHRKEKEKERRVRRIKESRIAAILVIGAIYGMAAVHTQQFWVVILGSVIAAALSHVIWNVIDGRWGEENG